MLRSLRFVGAGCLLCLGLGAARGDDVGKLVEQLKSKDVMQRSDAAKHLGSLRNAATAATPSLIEALKDASPEVRAYSADALGAIGDRRAEVVNALFAAVTDKSPMVRREALQALRMLQIPREEAIPRFAKILEQAAPEDVTPVLETLAEGGDRSVPFLVECLDDGDASYWACLALAEIGPPAKAAVPGLTKLAAHEDPEMRLEAIVALGEIGPDAKASTDALLSALTKDDFTGVRYAAAYSLGKIGAASGPVDSALTASAKSDDPFLALMAAWALSQLHPDDRAKLTQSVDAIVAALKSDKPELRAAGARCLVESNRTAEAAEVAAPHLAAGLKDADPVVVASALDAIAAMGEKAVPRATKALENPEVRLYAARVLQRIGPKAEAAVPALTTALSVDDPEFKREAQYALAMIGAPAAVATPELIKSLTSSDEDVRNSATFALGSIGQGAKDAVPALTQALSSEDQFTRFGAAWALVHIAPPDTAHLAKLLPVLIEGLSDDAEEVRLGAADTLAQIGPAAKAALPALQKARAGQHPEIVEAVDRAIAAINGKK